MPSMAGGAVLAVVAGLYVLAPGIYGALLHLIDIPPARGLFNDLAAIGQAAACAQRGVNVWVPNACMGGGVYSYAPLLLHWPWLVVLYTQTAMLGLGLVLVFLAAQAALPASQSRGELVARVLGTVSGAVIFALQRANLDALLFLGVLLAVGLLGGRGAARLVAYGLFGLLGALKYYPAVLLALVARERARWLALAAGPAALLGGVFLWRFGARLARALTLVPHGPPLGNCFGALDVPLAVGVWQGLARGASRAEITAFQLTPALHGLFWGLVALLVWRGWRGRAACRAGLTELAPFTQRLLLAGAMLIVACFLLAQNIDYRGIFLLLALPGLYQLRPRAAWVAVGLMSEGLFRIGALEVGGLVGGAGAGMAAYIVVWMVREALWWGLVARLLAVLLAWAELTLARWRCEMAGGS
ncbi:hypothetical protein [Acidocella sp.]|uniref:hypothetical protein n=1 Tax=Acidocella sp. TaxID=50710 RepID=UPI00261DA3B9|nr:hypothetical protein [Acidocella sp.]